MQARAADLTTDLVSALGPEQVVVDADILESYRWDRSAMTVAGRALAMVRARSVDDVVATLRLARAAGRPVVTRGAGSGLAGGANAVDGCVVLSTAAMNRVLDIDVDRRTATVECGVLTGDLAKAVAAAGMWYPPDPSSSDISHHRGQHCHQCRRELLPQVRGDRRPRDRPDGCAGRRNPDPDRWHDPEERGGPRPDPPPRRFGGRAGRDRAGNRATSAGAEPAGNRCRLLRQPGCGRGGCRRHGGRGRTIDARAHGPDHDRRRGGAHQDGSGLRRRRDDPRSVRRAGVGGRSRALCWRLRDGRRQLRRPHR